MTYPRMMSNHGKQVAKSLLTISFGSLGINTINEENPIMLKISKIIKLKKSAICAIAYDQSMIL